MYCDIFMELLASVPKPVDICFKIWYRRLFVNILRHFQFAATLPHFSHGHILVKKPEVSLEF